MFAIVLGCAYGVRRWVNELAARLFLIAWFCSPHPQINYRLLGWFDVITVGALTVCAVAPPAAVGIASLVLGFQHFEQGLFGLTVAIVLRNVVRGERVFSTAAAGYGGLLIGKLALAGYHRAADITPQTRMDFAADRGLADIFVGGIGQTHVLLFSAFGFCWVAVLGMGAALPDRQRWALAVILGGCLIPTLVTLDLTRVYAIITWPVLVVTCVWWSQRNDRRVERWAIYVLLASVIIPRVVLWERFASVSTWGRLR
jgi:hypothetical protein